MFSQREEIGSEKFDQRKALMPQRHFKHWLRKTVWLRMAVRKVGWLMSIPSQLKEYLDSDDAVKAAIDALHTKYDGKSLCPENKS